ncbi:MAG: bL21 family ribosomal protein, partial [Acidimicrobiales bacterium]
MYAVISSGGKQYRVAEGEQLEVELLHADSDQVSFTPILVVDGDAVVSSRAD